MTAYLLDENNDRYDEYSEEFSLKVLPFVPEKDEEEDKELVPKFDINGTRVYDSYFNIYGKELTIVKKVTTTELGPANPRQPIPEIKQLTPQGLLTISWSKQMKKPENLDELPSSVVVVTDEAEAEEVQNTAKFQIDKNSRRKLRKTREWFETEKEYLEYLLVMDALDIELIPEDSENSE